MYHIVRKNEDEIPDIELTISNRTLFRIVLVILIALALIAAFLKVTHAFLLIFIAFFLAVALNAPVSKIASVLPGKSRNSRSAATTVSFLVVILLLGGFAADVVPPLIHQTEKFVSAAPGLINSTGSQDSALGNFIRTHHLQAEVQTIASQLKTHYGVNHTAFSSIKSVASSVFSLLAVLVLTFMMLVEGPKWIYISNEMFIPKRHKKLTKKVAGDMYRVVKGYVNGQVLLAFIAAVLIAPALILLNVSYPIALMVVIFLAGLIPMIGHTIGAVIVTTVALFHSVPTALIVLAYYILYIQIENYLLQPKIQANSTNMSPLLVFSSIIVGVELGGLIGGLVAIPVAACIKVLFIEYLAQKQLLPDKFIESKDNLI